jgi:ketosteroid isomerase-like protein
MINLTDQKKKSVIEHFLSLYSVGRWGDPRNTAPLDELLDMLTDDVDWWIAGMPNSGRVTKGEFRAALAVLDTVTDGPLNIEPLAWTIQDNRIALEAASTMKLKSGLKYKNRYHFLFELRDGKISVYHEYHDTAHVASVLFPMTPDLAGR